MQIDQIIANDLRNNHWVDLDGWRTAASRAEQIEFWLRSLYWHMSEEDKFTQKVLQRWLAAYGRAGGLMDDEIESLARQLVEELAKRDLGLYYIPYSQYDQPWRASRFKETEAVANALAEVFKGLGK